MRVAEAKGAGGDQALLSKPIVRVAEHHRQRLWDRPECDPDVPDVVGRADRDLRGSRRRRTIGSVDLPVERDAPLSHLQRKPARHGIAGFGCRPDLDVVVEEPGCGIVDPDIVVDRDEEFTSIAERHAHAAVARLTRLSEDHKARGVGAVDRHGAASQRPIAALCRMNGEGHPARLRQGLILIFTGRRDHEAGPRQGLPAPGVAAAVRPHGPLAAV